jgi:hypothetical protein
MPTPVSTPSRSGAARLGHEQLALGVRDVTGQLAPAPGRVDADDDPPATAAAPSHIANSGTLSSRTPTWNGPGRRNSSSGAALGARRHVLA